MKKTSFLLEKLRDLSKDENSFNELLDLFADLTNDAENIFNIGANKNGECCFEGYFRTSFDPDDISKIKYSDSVKSITGFSNEELSAMPGKLLSIIHHDDFENVKKKYTHLLTGSVDEKCEIRYRVISKQKRVVYLHESFFIQSDESGNVVRCESITSNITEFMSRQVELESLYKSIEASLDERDKFINIISHDLRSPFTSLLGFSEILLNEPDLVEKERLEYLEYIHTASSLQLQFINNLLDWSRLKTGKTRLEIKRVSIRDIISNQVSLLTRNAVQKDIEIVVQVGSELYVSADERLVGEAVHNLLKNAIIFSERRKKVYISANRFKEGMIEVIIKDEGVGISEENQEKLFKIDQKFIEKGTAKEKGSGMGLNLVKEIITKHGGEIWFYSKIAEGSEFHFTLPEAQNIILIIEDDHEIRHLYKEIIDSCSLNYRVVEARNGYQAMSSIMGELPSLIITDHDMPLMNGIQLIEAVRKRDKRFVVPIVVISAKFDDELIQKYKDLGVEHLIPKPFEEQQLIDVVNSTLTA
ncbi:MAG: response regulator [Melioribacteraceae bacterium]|nr:response regulator [Melioribacteraceae bacterium]